MAVTYRFPSDHRSQAPSSGVSTWMGDQPGTPRAAGNIWCTRHMAKPKPQVGRVCLSHHENTPQFTIKCDWSLDLSKKKSLRSKVKKWRENADRWLFRRWTVSLWNVLEHSIRSKVKSDGENADRWLVDSVLIADWPVWCTVSSKSKPIKGAGFRKKLSFGKYSPRGKTEFSCVVKSCHLENILS